MNSITNINEISPEIYANIFRDNNNKFGIKFNGDTMIGLTERDNKNISFRLLYGHGLVVGNDGRVFTDDIFEYIANVKIVSNGNGFDSLDPNEGRIPYDPSTMIPYSEGAEKEIKKILNEGKRLFVDTEGNIYTEAIRYGGGKKTWMYIEE